MSKCYASIALFVLALVLYERVPWIREQSSKLIFQEVVGEAGQARVAVGRESLWRLDYLPHQISVLRLIPDGCVERFFLNESNLSHQIPENKRCNWREGFDLDLKPYLVPGSNSIRVKLVGLQGRGGLEISSPVWRTSSDLTVMLIVVIGLLLSVFSSCLVAWGLKSSAQFFCLLGISLTWYMTLSTGPYRFDNDTKTTVEYLLYLYERGRLPGYYEIFLGFHPPLYYLLCSLVYAISRSLWPGEALDVVRWFSLSCFSVFLAFGCLTIQNLVSRVWAQRAALALFSLWPLGLCISGRLNNEILSFSFAAFAINFVWRWSKDRRERDLLIASFAIAFGALSKASALPLWGLMGLFCYHARRSASAQEATKLSRRGRVLVGFCLILSTANFFRSMSYDQVGSWDFPLLVGNRSKANVSSVMVENSLANLVTFHVQDFLSVPYYDIFEGQSGRVYYPNAFLKSAVFGSFAFDAQILPLISYAAFLLILILLLVVNTLLVLRGGPFTKEGILIFWGCTLFFSASIFIRLYSGGNTVSQEFRYVYPCIIFFCAATGRLCQRFEHSQLLCASVYCLVLVFIASALGTVWSL